MERRPFFPALISLVCGAFAGRGAADKLALKKLACKADFGVGGGDSLRPRRRGHSKKYGAYFRNRSGRVTRSHHNPKYRKKLRYAPHRS